MLTKTNESNACNFSLRYSGFKMLQKYRIFSQSLQNYYQTPLVLYLLTNSGKVVRKSVEFRLCQSKWEEGKTFPTLGPPFNQPMYSKTWIYKINQCDSKQNKDAAS